MTSPTNDVSEAESPQVPRDLKLILKLQLPVIAVLAQKRMKMAEVLGLSVGSIIQLDKPSEDLLDLMVNDQRVGRGETVRIGENFGLQLVEIGSVEETIRKLGGEPEVEPEKEVAAEETDAEAPAEPDAETPAEGDAESE